MQISRRNAFTTIRTDGGLLPADLLLRIAEGHRSIDGLTPESYHLATSERLNEAATRAWNRLQGAWEGFRAGMDKLPEADAGTNLTRERWLLILFQELGYGRLQTARAIEIDGKSYPVSHIWQSVPIHLVSFRQELDRRTPGARGASRVSPHSLVQELLNRGGDHLWGFVSNGLRLRLLRDNASLTRAACVEFDLQSMMEGEVYSDFCLLFLLCHQSRVEAPEGKTVEHCWLERWYNTSLREGTRVLDHLRNGVERAIEALGGGFLGHAANTALRDKLRAGTLSTQDYYRQVLRVVYRLLFLFVAEDRELLLLPAGEDARLAAARDLYTRHYSTQRLRRLAERPRSARHADLYRALRLVFAKLHSGCPELALPALGSYLFAPTSTPDLNDADIANADLLATVWNLTFTMDGNVRRSVDYRNLGSEELGSVYESLLEMHPDVHLDAGKFKLRVAAGSERKTTGSYYTPTSLVNGLLDSALEPVLDEACKKPNPEEALLDLKVCDPACGSGHFLVAAAHRIAKRLAAIRAGEDEPAPESVQHALRDVVGRCIYGVDINPMAVELCKINLWLEALEPGRPLTFLDHHIRCGNSLLGTTPALMKRGIPDDAFKPLEGDDKKVCSELRKRNKAERRGQGSLPFGQPEWLKLGNLIQSFANLADQDDSTPEALAEKERRFAALVRSTPYENAWLLADAWCAAFVCEKRAHTPIEITEAIFRRWEESPHHLAPAEKEELLRLRGRYNFFHWHLAFPEVFKPKPTDQIGEDELAGWSGGFDCVLGNPPWEQTQLSEQEFFATRDPAIAAAAGADRKRRIEELRQQNPELWKAFKQALHEADSVSLFCRQSRRFPLTGRGKINTYAVFAELFRHLLRPGGRAGVIVPTGIATDDTTKFFFQDLIDTGSIVSLWDFENRAGIFPAVDSRYKFCLLTLRAGASGHAGPARFAFFLHATEDLSDPQRTFTLSAADIALLNPNTRTCPIFRSRADAELTKAIYRRVPVLLNEREGEAGNPWGVEFRQGLFNMTSDSHLFRTREQLQAAGFTLEGNIFRKRERTASGDWRVVEEYLPLYEAKMIWHFDHRWASYEGTDTRDLTDAERADPGRPALPRYWVPENEVEARLAAKAWDRRWLLGWRNITNATNEHTVIAAVIPRVGVGNSCPLALTTSKSTPYLATVLSAFTLDFVARQKVGGSNLVFFIFEQLPVLPPAVFERPCPWSPGEPLADWLRPRVRELTYTAHDIAPFARDLGYDGPPFRFDPERRARLRAELDAAFFHLYLPLTPDGQWKPARKADGAVMEETPEALAELRKYFPTPRDAAAYIMDTFPIVKRNDIEKHGRCRTKDTILEIYDQMQRVMAENAAAVVAGRQPTARYQTRLNPPPGPPADAGGNFIPLCDWDRADWPRHIHRPRE